MANWCSNEIRFQRELTEEEMIKIANLIGFKDEFRSGESSIYDLTIRPHILLGIDPCIEIYAKFEENLAGRKVNLEELMSLFYQINPFGLNERDLLKFCLYLNMDPEIASMMKMGPMYRDKLYAIYKLLSTYKDEILELKIKKFKTLKDDGFYSVEIERFEGLFMNFQTKWGPIKEEWFEAFIGKVSEVIGIEDASELTLYYEEPGNGVFGLYHSEYVESENYFAVHNDEDYSEYEYEEEEEE